MKSSVNRFSGQIVSGLRKQKEMKRQVNCSCGETKFNVDFPTDPYEQDLERSHRLGTMVKAICAKCGKEIAFMPTTRKHQPQIEISIGAVLKETATVTEGGSNE